MVASALLDGLAMWFRFVVGLVFLTAAVPKLLGKAEFERAVGSYGLLPARLVRPMAHSLPLLELGLGVGLLGGLFVMPLELLASALLIAFSVAVAANLVRGRDIDCGCRGTVSPRHIGWGLVASDVALANAGIIAALVHPGVLVVDSVAGPVSASSLRTSDAVALLLFASLALVGKGLIAAALKLRSTMRVLEAATRLVALT
jgi:hypothetical protein